MTIEQVQAVAYAMMSENQKKFSVDEDTEKNYLYRLAYNDGILDFADKLMNELRKEEVVSE